MAHYPTSATGLSYSTYPAGPTAAAQQVTASASANVKGSYVQLAASAGFTANALEVLATRATASPGRWLVDVATGAAGSETVVVPDLLVDMNQGVTSHYGSGNWTLPLAVASGTRIAVRTASSIASADLWIALLLVAAGGTPGSTAFVTYGADTSDSGGTVVDAGGGTANTKGSYTQLTASTGLVAQVIVPLVSMGGIGPATAIFAVDVATGAAGAETVLLPDLRMGTSGNLNDQRLSIRSLTFLTYIAAGTRIALRASTTVTLFSDRRFDAAILIASATEVPSTVTTLAASAITATSATLNGTATPFGTSISGFFRWDTVSPPVANSTTPAALGSGSSAVPFSANLSSLTSGVTYYVRAVITDGTTETLGSILSFVTVAATNHGFKADAAPGDPLEILYDSSADPLYVFVTWFWGAGGLDETSAVAGITFDGDALTRGGHKAVKGNTMEWWRLEAPATGVATLTVTMAAERLISIGAMNLTGWPSALADHIFAAAGDHGTRLAPFLRIDTAAGSPIVSWLGWNSPSQDVTADAGSTVIWNEEGLATAPGPNYNQLSAGATTTGLAVSTPVSWAVSVPTEYWGLAALTFIADDADPIQKVTQHVLLVGVDEDEEPLPALDPCTGGGTVASGTNPAAGPDLSTATVPLAWVEITLIDGSVQRWAKATIPHGTPKLGRVLTFGRVRRALTDGDGGPQASTVTTTFADTDRALRTAAFAGTLHFARVDYYVADLETIRAGGTAHRVFCGRVQDWTADRDLQFSITVQDELSARLTSANAQDAQSPIRTIDQTIHDNQPLASLFGKAAPEIYGSLSDEHDGPPIGAAGTWELRHIADQTIDPGPLAELGQLSVFLVCSGAVGQIQAVYAADLGDDPPVARRRVPPGAFGDWLFAPTIDGAWYDDGADEQFWIDTLGRRWTVVLGVASHPAIQLAVEGRIPLVVNCCGYEDVGDSTGATIDRPVRAFLHWLNNRVLQDTPEDWQPLESLGGYSMFDTDTFDSVDAICEARGYRVAGVLGHDYAFRSWRDRVAEWCLNFGFELGINRHGQLILVLLDREGDPPTVATLTPSTILEGGAAVTMRPDAVENIVPYVYARNYVMALQRPNPEAGARGLRDPYDGEWQSDRLEVVDEDSITALGGHPRGERRARLQEYGLVRDEATADQVAAERLDLHKPPNGRAEVTIDLLLRDGWALELGDVVSLEHWDLPWSGARRCHVRALELDLDELTMTTTVRDVEDLL